MSDAPETTRHTTSYQPSWVYIAPHFEAARLSDLLGEGPGAGFIQASGGQMTGPLMLAGDPQSDLQAATKRYVDSVPGNFVDAPYTGSYYARQFGAWQPVMGLEGGVVTGYLQVPPGATTNPSMQVGAGGTGLSGAANGSLLALSVQGTLRAAYFAIGSSAAQFYGDVSLLNNRITQVADPTAGADALNLRTADARYAATAPAGGYLPAAGGTMAGRLILAGDPGGPLDAAPQRYVDAARNGLLPLSGGTLTGPLTLSGAPAAAMHAATRSYVDEQVAALALFQGTWRVAANDPPINPPPSGLYHGYLWIAVTDDPGVPELPPDDMTGIAGMLISNGDSIIWNDLVAEWEHVRGSGLSRVEADATYVALAGSTMTGELVLDNGGGPLVGLTFNIASRIYEDGSAGLILRRDLLNNPVIIENNNGSARSQVLTQALGDTRYLQLVGGTLLNNLNINTNYGIIWTNGGIVFEQAAVGLTFRRSGGQNDLWTETNTGANRQRLLTEADVRASSMKIEPASVTVPGGSVQWTTYVDVNYMSLTRAGTSRLLISCAINLDFSPSGAVQLVGIRLNFPTEQVERRIFTYRTTNICSGIFCDFYADVVGPNPRIGLQLASIDPGGGTPAQFTTISGAGNTARSQVLVTDLGPV